MKKSLRIFTVLSVVASSILIVPSVSAFPHTPPTPISVTATATGSTTASVSFVMPSFYLAFGATYSPYTATSTPGSVQASITQAEISASHTGTISVAGLTPGTSYTFRVTVSYSYWFPVPVSYTTLSSASNSITTTSSVSAPGAPTSVTATSTGDTTANVSFTAPASNGGATITSYTATSSPGGITGSISQATSGTIAMTGLTAGTSYTFTVRATNSAGTGSASSASNSITTVGAPSAPTVVVATATGKRSATVSFGAPASNNGSAVTSYTATSTPGGITKTLTQAAGGTFTFDGLEPNTSYTFAVTATNTIGSSASVTSNSTRTDALIPASISSLTFVEDGTGTGGNIVWAGKSLDAVLYTGPISSYPGPYTYGAFTGGWNGRIRNLTPDTSYTISIYAISADGVGESKSLTFKTSAILPTLPGVKSATISQADQMTNQLPKLYAWINENVFVDGEGDRMKTVLNKFDAVTVPTHSAYLKLPNSTVVKVSATSSTPAVCKVEGQVTVHSIAAGTCTISYTVSGASKAPATLVKDFVFKKFAK